MRSEKSEGLYFSDAMTRLRKVIQHWYGQVAIAALAGLLCFFSMYAIYLHLSKRLPDGSKIYQKTGYYEKKNWSRGESTSTLGTSSVFCLATAFRANQCGMDGSGNTVTATLTSFPRLWGDVDVVIEAKTNNEVLSDFKLKKVLDSWRDQSITDCYWYSSIVFLFAFLGVRGLAKHNSKE